MHIIVHAYFGIRGRHLLAEVEKGVAEKKTRAGFLLVTNQ